MQVNDSEVLCSTGTNECCVGEMVEWSGILCAVLDSQCLTLGCRLAPVCRGETVSRIRRQQWRSRSQQQYEDVKQSRCT